MIRIAVRAVALALALAGAASAQEAAVTRRATELREAPAETARSLAALPAQAPVTRGTGRSGPWVQVRTEAGASGWLHLFDLGPAGTASASGASDVVGSALRGVTGLFGNRQPPQASASAGIRGLEAQDIARANPEPAAVTRMEALRQNEADARAFAAGAQLQPVAIQPLPAP
ncbi:SH3 domain-containing protein [Ramlibacter sp. AN1133]|uniref:SH3 domain-containing protein n=1 Tax=Ramlibacter sp. AN1133 TaxID=3133429 RepID=UPI0030BEDC44